MGNENTGMAEKAKQYREEKYMKKQWVESNDLLYYSVVIVK